VAAGHPKPDALIGRGRQDVPNEPLQTLGLQTLGLQRFGLERCALNRTGIITFSPISDAENGACGDQSSLFFLTPSEALAP
jgi:hypothetical protein